jgi:hypothetical protein
MIGGMLETIVVRQARSPISAMFSAASVISSLSGGCSVWNTASEIHY